jgi:hypothetical protein
MPRPPRIAQRRQEFVEDLDGVKNLADDVTTFAAVGGTWAAHLWKAHAAFEMLAVRAYAAWESFSHDVLILTLAADTSELANETGLSIKPTRVTADMAEALLTARGYLEFRDVADLKGRARRWLGQARSPFERMQPAEIDAANDLRALRNFIVHRSRQSERTYEELLRKRRLGSAPLPGEYLYDGSPTRLHGHVEQLRLAAWRLVP